MRIRFGENGLRRREKNLLDSGARRDGTDAARFIPSSKTARRCSLRTSLTTGTLFGDQFRSRNDTSVSIFRRAVVAQENDVGDRMKTQQGQSFAVGGPTKILDSFTIIEVSQLSPF